MAAALERCCTMEICKKQTICVVYSSACCKHTCHIGNFVFGIFPKAKAGRKACRAKANKASKEKKEIKRKNKLSYFYLSNIDSAPFNDSDIAGNHPILLCPSILWPSYGLSRQNL